MLATVSIISIYREGNLAIQQAGKNMSVKLTVVCKQCPLLRRGKDGAVVKETASEQVMELSREGLVSGRRLRANTLPTSDVDSRLTHCPLLMGRDAFSHEHEGKKKTFIFIFSFF